ncbi:MAG: YihY/virulence factor BrkB family protein [Deltaproteobacteria bacterium]|nr:MAG: YihY/virulence factor BrkB family protein [Deltaproteobacteria bacterium]
MKLGDLTSKLESWWRVVLAYTEDMRRHDVLQAASAMAFHSFFSLVPLVAITGWVVHLLTRGTGELADPFMTLAPGPVVHLADSEFMRLSDGSETVLAPLGALGFLWLSSGGVNTAMVVFERIFDAPRRSTLRRRLLSFVFVIVAMTVVSLGAAATVSLVWIGTAAAVITGMVVPLVVVWLMIASFFRYATRRPKGAPRSGFRGAGVTLLLWVAVSFSFSLYVRQLAAYSQFYGGLAAVVVVLIWLWLMSFALLIGGEINARIEGVRSRLSRPTVA